MAKKLARVVALALTVSFFTGCARGGEGLFDRVWKHLQWHLLGAYKDLVELHKEIDRYIFNLDERNPDRY
ncbi:MAG: hypothetical protein HYY17_01435 [Planctomycetes bacterium]|nr:hypothetical protein [Planctomycetota bacterium]